MPFQGHAVLHDILLWDLAGIADFSRFFFFLNGPLLYFIAHVASNHSEFKYTNANVMFQMPASAPAKVQSTSHWYCVRLSSQF